MEPRPAFSQRRPMGALLFLVIRHAIGLARIPFSSLETDSVNSSNSQERMKYSVRSNLHALWLIGSSVTRQMSREGALAALQRGFRLLFLRVVPLVFHLRGHLRLTRILTSPHALRLTQRHPKLAYKYLGGNYLAHNLSTGTRLATLINHYDFLRQHVVEDFLPRIFDTRQRLWQEACGDHIFSIALSFPMSLHHPGRTVDHEGDLALTFLMDAVPLYVFCFTIIPTSAMQDIDARVAGRQAIFIGRIQGVGGRYDEMKKATKLLHDISPKDLLLAATQAVALSLGIRTLVGVRTEDQLSRGEQMPSDENFFDYDGFWMALEAERTKCNRFLLPLPLPEKPIALIAQHHRSRTLRKRRFKEHLMEEVRDTFQTEFLKKSSATHHVSKSDQVCVDYSA